MTALRFSYSITLLSIILLLNSGILFIASNRHAKVKLKNGILFFLRNYKCLLLLFLLSLNILNKKNLKMVILKLRYLIFFDCIYSFHKIQLPFFK